MKKPTKEILERDAKRDIGTEILQAIREIKADQPGRVFKVSVSEATKARFKREISTARSDRELTDIVRARAKENRIKVNLDEL